MIRKGFFVSCVMCLLVACSNGSEVTSSQQALGADVLSFKYRGSFASAVFTGLDNCNFTSIYVSVGTQVVKDGTGQPIESQQAYMFVDLFDVCDQIGKFGFASLEVQPDLFEAPTNQLDSASLDASGELCFVDGLTGDALGCEQVSVSLDWTGFGDIYRGMYRNMYMGPGIKMMFRDNGTYREANVSGVVNIPTVSVDLTSFGSLSMSKGGSVTIIK